MKTKKPMPKWITNNVGDALIIQECGECGLTWYNKRVNTRCPICGSYEIIVDVEWEDVSD